MFFLQAVGKFQPGLVLTGTFPKIAPGTSYISNLFVRLDNFPLQLLIVDG